MATQQNDDAVFRWLAARPWPQRFVCVSVAVAFALAAVLLKFQNSRDIPPWDMPHNRDGYWRVVEHPDGTVDVSRGTPRFQPGDVTTSFTLTIKAKAIGTVSGDQPNALTVWIERTVKVEREIVARKADRLDPVIEKRFLGHVAARFTDPELASMIAAGGGTTSRTYWGWVNIFLWIGMGVAAPIELLVWFVRWRTRQRRGYSVLVENEA